MPIWTLVRPRFGYFQDFSDSFKAKFAFWAFYEVRFPFVTNVSKYAI